MTLAFIVLVCILGIVVGGPQFYKGKRISQLGENDRVEFWEQTYGHWPYRWQNETAGHDEKNRQREEELMQLPGSRERWENWMQFVSGQMVPSFTQTGFKLFDTPPHVHAKLKAALDKGLENFDALPSEGNIDVIYGPVAPKFLNIGQVVFLFHFFVSLFDEWLDCSWHGRSTRTCAHCMKNGLAVSHCRELPRMEFDSIKTAHH